MIIMITNVHDSPLFGRASVEQNSAKFSFNIAHKSLSSFGLSNRGARDLQFSKATDYSMISSILKYDHWLNQLLDISKNHFYNPRIKKSDKRNTLYIHTYQNQFTCGY